MLTCACAGSATAAAAAAIATTTKRELVFFIFILQKKGRPKPPFFDHTRCVLLESPQHGEAKDVDITLVFASAVYLGLHFAEALPFEAQAEIAVHVVLPA